MILFHNQVFTLHTRNTSYQMKVDSQKVLLHTYYGEKIRGGDMSYLIRQADRGFSPNPNQVGRDRTYSLDTLPQEYSTCGVGDYRVPSIEVALSDGSHLTDLRYVSHRILSGKYTLPGLPAFYGHETQGETLIITLEDAAAHLQIDLYYGVLPEYDLITRAARIRNCGDLPIHLVRAMSLCLDLPPEDWDFVTFDGGHVQERCPTRQALRPGMQSVGSVRGTSSHQHNPFVMLCHRDTTEDAGLVYGAMLVYSGNFEAQVEKSQFGDARLVMGLGTQHFSFRLLPGEEFTTPEAAMVCSPKGFTPMSQQFHRAIRSHLCRDPYAGRRRPVLINNWEATYFDFTPEKLLEMAKTAADLGLELFVLDDGWFGHRNDDFGGLGDWWVNQEKLPMGLKPLAERIRQLGMEFGIWVEPEMVSEDSQLYREHPDWVLSAPNRPPARGRSQLVLDLSRPEVQAHLLDTLEQLLASAPISYMKWDMNRSLSDVWSAALPPDRQGEVYHRYVLGVYHVLEVLRTRHPSLLIEGCSGGGGRFDGGMLYYCPQIWCSDNTDAMDRLRIQYGTSFCYPVSTMGSHVAAVPNHQTGRVTPLSTRGVVAMSGTFGYEMDLSQATEEEKQEMSRQIARYKSHAQLIAGGDYYRLTDPFQPGPFTAWAIVSPDRQEVLVSLVSGSTHAAQPFWALHLKGLDPELDYQLGDMTYPGDALMSAGYPIDLGSGDYRALQLYFTAKQEKG